MVKARAFPQETAGSQSPPVPALRPAGNIPPTASLPKNSGANANQGPLKLKSRNNNSWYLGEFSSCSQALCGSLSRYGTRWEERITCEKALKRRTAERRRDGKRVAPRSTWVGCSEMPEKRPKMQPVPNYSRTAWSFAAHHHQLLQHGGLKLGVKL